VRGAVGASEAISASRDRNGRSVPPVGLLAMGPETTARAAVGATRLAEYGMHERKCVAHKDVGRTVRWSRAHQVMSRTSVSGLH